MENAIGTRLPQLTGRWDRAIPARLERLFYRLALDRGYLDSCLEDFIIAPFMRVFRWCDALERRWIDFLSGDGTDDDGEVAEPARVVAKALEALP